MKHIEVKKTQDGILTWYWRFKMKTYRYRVYLTDSRVIDIPFQAISPSQGQLAVQAQYAGLRVVWIG